MIFKESGLLRALKAAHKQGYEIIPNGERVTICTKNWAIEADAADLPLKVSLEIVEHAGYMPTSTPVRVCKGCTNQTLFAEAARVRMSDVHTDSNGDWEAMTAIPIIFRNCWQLFVTESKEVFAFDTELLDIMDTEKVTPSAMMRTGYIPAGVFELGGSFLMVAPGGFSTVDALKLVAIANLEWDLNRAYGDPTENLSLFDDMEEDE